MARKRKTKRRKVRAPKLAGRKPRKGARKGQSKHWGSHGYLKGGKYHRYSLSRDRDIKAKRKRKPGEATWRGDLPGSLI